MKNFILLTEKVWHNDLFLMLCGRKGENWIRINQKKDFSFDKLVEFKPDKIFIPHWSYLVPAEIFSTFECVVFHMTDLPFGRGGSPLQNLIVRGFKETKISALRVGEGLDTGPIYLKNQLSLEGSAHDIFKRGSLIIFHMIEKIIANNPIPEPQKGDVVVFNRRTPEQSDISNLGEMEKLFDQIRMLDAPGYPKAFLGLNALKLEFFNARLVQDEIIANVRIIKK
jgi:methionyl-tRNA formyltransferase